MSNNEYIDEQGAHWNNWVEYKYMKGLHMCGCGLVDSNIVFFRNMLKAYDLKKSEREAAQRKLIADNMENVHEILLHLLSNRYANLIVHGFSIDSSWPTDEGKRFIKEAEEYEG